MWKLIHSLEDKTYSIFDNKEKKIVSKYEECYMDEQDVKELNRIVESFNKIINI